MAEDEDEGGLKADWTQAKLVLPQPKQSVRLHQDQDIIAFFKAQGKEHLTWMQAVLKAYVDTHRQQHE